ncbi:MAG: methylmalonyl Co-A mutase-associated GTPase MeaB [Saprospiraceae bacterium]
MYKDNIRSWYRSILDKDRLALSKAITLIESQKPEDLHKTKELMELISESRESQSFRIGITGPPGVGKSTLIDALGQLIIQEGHRLAVLSIDPSSTISKGSILGDKSRMQTLSLDANAFLRPSPSSNQLGGISRSTRNSILLLEAAGFDRILVETVGIGQSETDVAQICDLVICLIQPASGDELQALKSGIMEWADMFVVNKSDGVLESAARETYAELHVVMNHLPMREVNYKQNIQLVSALNIESVKQLLFHINEFYNLLNINNELFNNRNVKLGSYFEKYWLDFLKDKIQESPSFNEVQKSLRQEIQSGNIEIEKAFEKLINFIFALQLDK